MKFKDLLYKIFNKPAPHLEMTDDVVFKFIQVLEQARADELDCQGVYARLDEFVEHEVHGKDVEKIAPLIREHLDMCSDCYDEYEALLRVIENTK
ncbi:MAG: hypothetical protein UZ14_CFX002001755 [Chloroflexi bacterium OLB14]|nr:MAG: hypothetical protein UZ14_CFX002001755 [Chloroflexi bacterium OLB14]